MIKFLNTTMKIWKYNAWVVELVYTHDLKSCPSQDAGSTPALGTIKIEKPPIAQLVEQPALNR